MAHSQPPQPPPDSSPQASSYLRGYLYKPPNPPKGQEHVLWWLYRDIRRQQGAPPLAQEPEPPTLQPPDEAPEPPSPAEPAANNTTQPTLSKLLDKKESYPTEAFAGAPQAPPSAPTPAPEPPTASQAATPQARTLSTLNPTPNPTPTPETSAVQVVLHYDYLGDAIHFEDNSHQWEDFRQQFLEAARRALETPVVSRGPNKKRTDTPTEAEAEADTLVPLSPPKNRIDEIAEYFSELKTTRSIDMTCLIMYDIEDNKIRTRLAEYLHRMGLRRIQKSVFLGQIDRNIYNKIYETVKAIEAQYAIQDSVIFMPISEDDVYKMRLVGREVDLSYTLYTRHTVVI